MSYFQIWGFFQNCVLFKLWFERTVTFWGNLVNLIMNSIFRNEYKVGTYKTHIWNCCSFVSRLNLTKKEIFSLISRKCCNSFRLLYLSLWNNVIVKFSRKLLHWRQIGSWDVAQNFCHQLRRLFKYLFLFVE